MENLEQLKYPIGKLVWGKTYTFAETQYNISRIEMLPKKLTELVNFLSEEQLQNSYRPDGWSGVQIVHHIADSHMNAYIRLKLALTEDTPTIRPYLQDEWAKLADVKTVPIAVSLKLIEALHIRMVAVLRSMNETDFEKKYYHPENKILTRLDDLTQAYAWHGEHHLGHLMWLKK